jgi:hypothetical protein
LFLGLTGWYDFAYPGMPFEVQEHNWATMMNDKPFICFEDKPENYGIGHAHILDKNLQAAYVNDRVEEIVIVTHMIPIIQGCVPPDHPWAATNGSFYNSKLDELVQKLQPKVKAWCFGHTHFPIFRIVNNVPFYCNPRGYSHEKTGRAYKAIVVDTEDELVYK